MRVCKVEFEKRIIPETRNMKTDCYCILCLLLLLPSKTFAYSEDTGGVGYTLIAILIISILGTIGIVVYAIYDQDPKLKPVLIIAGLIGVNIALMFTSIAVAIISQFTIPILFLILLGVYYGF